MISVSVEDELTINRPRREVFAVLADKQRLPAWMAGVKRAKRLSTGPLGPGATYAVVGKMLGRRLESTYEITGYEPPSEVSGRLASSMFTFTETYRLEEDDDGATVVRLEAVAEPGRSMRFLWPLLAMAVPKQVKADHRRLKTILERKRTKAVAQDVKEG
ncbi:MAG: SRPBCC family protein [Acidimicrobiia bacterium]